MISVSIDLWIIQLDSVPQHLDDSLALLSEDEKARVERFSFDDDKRHYIQAHASLRRILAGYISVKPEAIRFKAGAYGKPALHHDHTGKRVHFNLSHTAGMALIAICPDRPVGVDVERIKPLTDHFKIAEHYFAPAEVEALKHIPTAQSHEGFIQLWTGKEALVKARGNGLSLPLNDLNLAGLIDQTGNTGCKVVLPDSTVWFVNKTELIPGYLGAVAAEGENWTTQYCKR